jgi:hypothetical protein
VLEKRFSLCSKASLSLRIFSRSILSCSCFWAWSSLTLSCSLASSATCFSLSRISQKRWLERKALL